MQKRGRNPNPVTEQKRKTPDLQKLNLQIASYTHQIARSEVRIFGGILYNICTRKVVLSGKLW
jgi:hypothetical protein